jgi:hypothetical protein
MKKYVREKLDEEWTTSDTGIDNFSNYFQPQKFNDDEDSSDSDLKSIIPPITQQLTAKAFEEYVNELIEEVLPNSPGLALKIFTSTLKEHPYLTRRPIGFKSHNVYRSSIDKFLHAVQLISKKQ